MDFILVDIETANSSPASICQIGCVKVQNGKIASEGAMLIDPKCEFEPINISIHGIRPEHVVGHPTFEHAYEPFRKFFDNQVVFSHSAFDNAAFNQACDLHGYERFNWKWMDSTRIIRKTWAEFSQRGYGLKNLASHFGYEFKHHDALEDARLSTNILLRALAEHDLTLDDWMKEIKKPIPRKSR